MATSCVGGVLRQSMQRLWVRQRSALIFRCSLSTASTQQPNTESVGSAVPTTETPPAGGSAGQTANGGLKADDFSKEKAELKKQMDELNDKYMRALAETQNVRMRMQRQADDAKKFGVQSMCKDLVDVADVLERAVESGAAAPDDLAAAKEFARAMHAGTQMTLSQLMKVFSKYGLEKIAPEVGEKFDPNIHQALFQQPVPDSVPGSVFVTTKVGYRLHERTLRPALVGVVQGPK